jgi:hypothetical protein
MHLSKPASYWLQQRALRVFQHFSKTFVCLLFVSHFLLETAVGKDGHILPRVHSVAPNSPNRREGPINMEDQGNGVFVAF